MEKKIFNRLDEEVFVEKLDNGLEVYLYPTKKTKNFYITISVKYGANVIKYKKGNKIVDVIPGSAHFLEHKVMALSENEEISKRINDLGSLANAWTSYYGTNYNIFGSINLKENLRLLLDIFYNTDINEKNVEEEKGIIGEEIDMYKDQIDGYLYHRLFSNLFHDSYIKNTVVGERSDIEKITAESLNEIYNDYYVPNNTFIVVCGDFDKDDIMNEIKEYMKGINIKPDVIPVRVKEKELSKVGVLYEEVSKDISNTRVKYGIKIDKKLFNIKDEDVLKFYISIILSTNFSSTSKLYEKYKSNNIMIGMSYGVNIIDDYLVININSVTKNDKLFINNISKDIHKLDIKEKDFIRKKKSILKNVIIDFDNIEDVEYNICTSLMMDNRIDFDIYNSVNNMNYEEILRVLSIIKDNISSDNISVIKTIK